MRTWLDSTSNPLCYRSPVFARRCLVSAVLAMPVVGCSLFEGKSWVYVDNGSSSAVEVSVDGGKVVTAPVRGTALVKVGAGTHRFLVRRGNEVVYDQSREFPDSPTVAKYVLNPDGNVRYTRKRVKYRPRTWGRELPLLPFQALQEAVVLKPDPWVPGWFDYVPGEAPPAEIKTKEGETPEPVARLCRIAASDYDLVANAKDAVTKDLHAVMSTEAEDALRRVLGACP